MQEKKADFRRVSEKIYANRTNKYVLRFVPQHARSILDVGCGSGVHASVLKTRFSSCSVDGITLSPAEAEIASASCDRVWVHNLEQGLPKSCSDKYDCIICSHVIEHLCWPNKMLADVKNALMPARGRLVVALPNMLFLKQRMQFLAGNFRYQSQGPWDETHLRWYTYQSGQQLLENAGFMIESASVEGYMPFGQIRLIAPRLTNLLDQFVCRRWPGLFGWQLVYVARSVAV